MSIFGANHPLHLENDKNNILLKVIRITATTKMDSKDKTTFSSFFRTAGGDLISTEN